MTALDSKRKIVRICWLILTFILGGSAIAFWLHRKPSQIILEESAPSTVNHPSTPTTQVSQDALSSSIQEWISHPWSSSSFDQGLSIIRNRAAKVETRLLVMESLASKTRVMSDEQLRRFLDEITKSAKDSTEPPQFVAVAISVMTRLMTIVGDKGIVSRSEVMQEALFLVDFARDNTRDNAVRGQAIQAIGNLGMLDGFSVVEAILADSKNLNIPELARSGCLSLFKLAAEKAGPNISEVLSNTSDLTVFGTAAYCLGNIKTTISMVALIKNTDRFPDSPAIGAALVDLDEVIQPILENPNSPNVIEAIAATKYLWRNGQVERYSRALRELLVNAPDQVRIAALNRLVELAQSRGFEAEKSELTDILVIVRSQASLAIQAEKIQQRLSAKILTPNGASETTPIRAATK